MPLKLFACALCYIYDPTVLVDVELNILKDRLETVEFRWEFSKKYTQKAIENYDKNGDAQLDQGEMALLQREFTQALLEKGMHTSTNLDQEPIPVEKQRILSPRFEISDQLLYFFYTLRIDRALHQDHFFQLTFEDKGGFFGFFLRPSGLKLHSDNYDWQMGKEIDSYRWPTLHLFKENSMPSQSGSSPQKKADSGGVLAILLESAMKYPYLIAITLLALLGGVYLYVIHTSKKS